MLKTTNLCCIFRWTIWIPVLILYTAPLAYAQQEQIIKEILERSVPELPEDYDLSELTEQLNGCLRHPINLNKTSPEELKKLIFLSPLQISNFFTHLSRSGKLLALEELQSIDGFDLQTIQYLLPFVTLGASAGYQSLNFKNILNNNVNSVILRWARVLERQKGFEDLPGTRYLGSPEKLLLKYNFSYADRLQFSALFKKDAGEEFFKGSNAHGFDFMSFSAVLNHSGRLEKLVIGDYSLQFGQGLALWSGFSFGKGPDVTNAAKKDLGLKAYTSANESSFFRGAAAVIRLSRNFLLTPFFSSRKLDASLKALSGEDTGQVNISVSGLHRTKTELQNRKSLSQMVYGSAFQYLSNNFCAGITTAFSHYDHAFTTGTQLYNAKGFTGKDLVNVGFHYNYTFRNIYIFGEVAKSFNGKIAYLNGIMASLSPSFSAVFVNRDYDPEYHCYFSQSLGETTEAANEKGWYAGLNYIYGKKWTASVSLDLFRFPWLKYRINEPSGGMETGVRLQYSPTKTFRIAARFKMKETRQNTDSKVKVKYLERVNKQNYKLEVHWSLNKKIRLEHAAELCSYQKDAQENGYLVYQDLEYAPLSSRISGNIRLAYFCTDSYNSRLYAYEDDVLHGSGFGMYNGSGFRTYLNLKYRLFRNVELWGRYAIFLYPGVETIGTGLDQLSGNRKSEFKFQVRYQF